MKTFTFSPISVTEKIWGHEELVVSTSLYTFKILHLKKNFRCSLHYHPIKDETFVVMFGHVELIYIPINSDEKRTIILTPGKSFRIYPNMKHSFKGLDDSIIFEVSTEDIASDSIRLDSSCEVK